MGTTRFEAVIFDSSRWSPASAGLGEVLRARCDALAEAGVVVHDVGCGDARAIVEIAAGLAAKGITGRLIAIVGDTLANVDVPELRRAVVTPTPDGSDGFVSLIRLLDRQLALRADRRVPRIDDDPAWVVRLPADPVMVRASEALGTLANGLAGVRGRREDGQPVAVPSMVVSGVYTDADGQPRLLGAPEWTALSVDESVGGSQLLDLRSGLLLRRGRLLRTLRFVSAARLDAMALRAEGRASTLGHPAGLAPADTSTPHRRVHCAEIQAVRTRSSAGGGVTVAVHDHEDVVGKLRVIERLATVAADQRNVPDWDRITGQLDDLVAAGFDRLLADHREAWAQRWANARVDIEGCPGDELAARFAVFHLLGSTLGEGEAAVGARGLTGPAYGGHVFWDADVFVLPFARRDPPAAARAMLEYRIRRLPGGHGSAARPSGSAGARFPWESAATGTRRHPASGHAAATGELVPIRTGRARGAHRRRRGLGGVRATSTGPATTAFLRRPGAELARSRRPATGPAACASTATGGATSRRDRPRRVPRARRRQRLHQRDGPLEPAPRRRPRRGASARCEEPAGWREIADPWSTATTPSAGLYEQFAGFCASSRC